MSAEKPCASCGNLFVVEDDEKWKKVCFGCWKASKNKSINFNDEFRGRLRGLLQLCHPDRHAGSTLAKEVTQWLLAQKEK